MVKINAPQIRARLPLVLATAIVAIVCALQIWAIGADENQIRNQQKASAELRKILILSYGIWQERGELKPEVVWRRLSRKEPLRDPWGNPYKIEANAAGLRCSSAGPDGVWNTLDDLEQWLPRNIPSAEQNGIRQELSTQFADPSKSVGSGAQ